MIFTSIVDIHNSSHNVMDEPSSFIDAFPAELFPTPQVTQLVPDDDHLQSTFGSHVEKAFNKTHYYRRLFFDFQLRLGTWRELLSRLIPHTDVLSVLSIYAFANFSIFHQLSYVKRSKTQRHYACKFCKKFYIILNCKNPLEKKDHWLWEVDEELSSVGSKICTCTGSKLATPLNVYDVALANNPHVRSIVKKGLLLPVKTLEKEINLVMETKIGIVYGENFYKKITSCNLRQAIRQLQFLFIHQTRYLYNDLPQYLSYFASLNPDSSVVLQSDQRNQFYRLFVGFPIARHYGILTIPILNIDSFHYQSKQYDGVAIVLTSKTGFGRNIMLAFAIIPVEDTNNIAWFLQMCHRHGIDFSTSPLFTDQGPLISAVRQLLAIENFMINIMLCLYSTLSVTYVISFLKPCIP